jgi:hypothetical protein
MLPFLPRSLMSAFAVHWRTKEPPPGSEGGGGWSSPHSAPVKRRGNRKSEKFHPANTRDVTIITLFHKIFITRNYFMYNLGGNYMKCCKCCALGINRKWISTKMIVPRNPTPPYRRRAPAPTMIDGCGGEMAAAILLRIIPLYFRWKFRGGWIHSRLTVCEIKTLHCYKN